MPLLPALYAVALIGVAAVLVLPRPRLTFTTYYLAIFAVYHGPAFFTYHQASGPHPLYERLAGVLCLSLGCFAAGRWLAEPSGRVNEAARRWMDEPLADTPISPLVLWTAVAAVCGVALVNLLWLGAGSRLLEGLSLTADDLVAGEYRRLRSENAEVNAAGLLAVAFTYLCRHGLGPFLALFMIVVARRNPQPARFGLALGMTSLIAAARLSSLAKSDAVYFLGQVLLAWVLAGPAPVRLLSRQAVVAIMALFVALVGVYMRFTTADGVAMAIWLIWCRITDIPNLCLARYFEYFPDLYDHTWGMNIRLLHGLFAWGETYVPAHSLIDDNGSNANAIYVADAWVDFSWAGVAASSLLVGWTIGLLDRLVFTRRDTVNVALLVALLAPVHSLMSMSLVTCFGGFGLLTLPLFARILRLDLQPRTTGAPLAQAAAPRPLRRPAVVSLPA